MLKDDGDEGCLINDECLKLMGVFKDEGCLMSA